MYTAITATYAICGLRYGWSSPSPEKRRYGLPRWYEALGGGGRVRLLKLGI
ncbi:MULTISPECIES: hypothetical protein [Pyrobaculum]|uniref:Uncharacterized protein n=2 Tax=Pyrobaculum TaxID=2276 RepID=A0A7L4P948_9CREN|nr:hypothetical protein [Pyrobaculum arsenaticum]MCY0891160.1 hypothetical protein [Pyrobaculum arsenaticum]NYR15441.1 hypothetical protein [Pyrobaculum arsenaticum]